MLRGLKLGLGLRLARAVTLSEVTMGDRTVKRMFTLVFQLDNSL